MVSSIRRDLENRGMRFRRRRLLDFLMHSNRFGTFDALAQERRIFFEMRTLQRLVAEGQWLKAQGYAIRLLPNRDDQMGVEARTLLRFITHLQLLDDLKQGKPRAVENLPSPSVPVPVREHRDWRLVKLKAAEIVKDLLSQAPEFRRLLRLQPRCPTNLPYAIPYCFGNCQRRKRNQSVCRMPASLLARQFLLKARRYRPERSRGLSSEPTEWLQELIGVTLRAGEPKIKEHSLEYSCREGMQYSVEGHTGDVRGVKQPHNTGKFGEDVKGFVGAPSDGMELHHIFNMVAGLSSGMLDLLEASLLFGKDRSAFSEKLVEQERRVCELKLYCMKAILFPRGSGGNCTRAISASDSCSVV